MKKFLNFSGHVILMWGWVNLSRSEKIWADDFPTELHEYAKWYVCEFQLLVTLYIVSVILLWKFFYVLAMIAKPSQVKYFLCE